MENVVEEINEKLKKNLPSGDMDLIMCFTDN